MVTRHGMGAESKLSAEAAARFVLGLSQGCSKEEVKRAFKRLALVFHPDKNKGQNEEEATRRFQAIATAKDLLLKTSGVTGAVAKEMGRPRATAAPTPKKPVYVATWMCGACQMRHLGSSPGSARTSEVACARASSSTLCFCGHRFGAHEVVEGGSGSVKFRCRHAGCACANFSYVPPGALCTCGHGPQSHDAKPFHSCQVSGCLCQTFHHAGVCSCRHSWACHRTEIQKAGSPYAGNPSTTKSQKTTFCPWRRPCYPPEFSESDDGETKDAKTSMPSTGSSRPPATPQRAASPQMPAQAPPAASAVPRGRVSAPSTPTGRRSSSFSTVGGDRFCMPTSTTSTASRPPSQTPIPCDGGAAGCRDPRLDVRGKPIGRSPSVASTGAATTDSQPRSATPRQSFAEASPKKPEAANPSESKKSTRLRPSSAPPRRESEAVPPVPPPVVPRPPRPRPSSAGAKTSSRGATSAATPMGKEAGEKAEKSCPRWEDVNAEPDAEPDTEAEKGSSSHPREGVHQARIPRSAENPSPKRTWTVNGNPSGSASKVAAQAEAAAKAKAGARPWWLRLSRSKGMEDSHGEAFAATASAETVDEDAGDERMPTARQRSQRSSAPSAVRFMKRPPRPSSTPPESPWTPPATAGTPAQTPEPAAAAVPPRRPPVPRAPRPKSAPPKRSVSFEASPPDVVPRFEEDNRDTKVAKDSSRCAENLKEGSTQERPVPSWPWVSPRFFGADSDDEGGPSNAPAKNPSETLRRLMELQRTLPTPIL